jgi:undecaprenyl pyrophosphate phosphatase UppP
LRMIIKKDKFKYFSYYCFGVGMFAIIYSLIQAI